MKTTKSVSLLILLTVLFTSCTVRQVQHNKRTVSVSGSGTVVVEAETATIILSVITTARDATTAATNNATKMNAVNEAILALGVDKESISTQNYSIRQDTSTINTRIIYGDYKVSNEIKVFLKDKTLASKVIDEAIKAGANRLSSLTFGVLDAELAIKQARILAVQQAQEAAALIAGTSGAELGKVLTIEEYRNNSYPKLALMETATALDKAANISTPISGGKSSITVNVNATYELK